MFWNGLRTIGEYLTKLSNKHVENNKNQNSSYAKRGKRWYTQGDEKESHEKGGNAMECTGYNINQIANWFLRKSKMPHKKLQKLCYYAVAWGYALLNRPIVINPEFQAWVHGPVSPLLYDTYRGSGWEDLNPNGSDNTEFDDTTLDLLESIWFTYGGESGNSLEALSHSEYPWIKARGNCANGERCQTPISPIDMREYYKSIYIGGDEVGE